MDGISDAYNRLHVITPISYLESHHNVNQSPYNKSLCQSSERYNYMSHVNYQDSQYLHPITFHDIDPKTIEKLKLKTQWGKKDPVNLPS